MKSADKLKLDALKEAIELYQAQVSEYPDDLEDLLDPPGGFSPYVIEDGLYDSFGNKFILEFQYGENRFGKFKKSFSLALSNESLEKMKDEELVKDEGITKNKAILATVGVLSIYGVSYLILSKTNPHSKGLNLMFGEYIPSNDGTVDTLTLSDGRQIRVSAC